MKRKDFLRASGMFPFVAKSLSLRQHPNRLISPHEQQSEQFFYRPQNAWAGDFIPMYAEGKFQLFYLHDFRNAEEHGEGVPWYRLSTTDFVKFEEHGEVLARGSKNEQDLFVFTGSALKAEDKYHIFYTGHNHHLAEAGKPMQGIMHATSDDLQHWTKIPDHIFYAPDDRYEQNDWRDPYVFFNEETKEYNMLLAARLNKGMPRRRGITALCTSKDLIHWNVKEPLYLPNQFITHECPDLFKMGEWWYLVFSEYCDVYATRYRMSRSLKGPWLTPAQDTFDGHAFYAAKTASDGKRRYVFGWNPTRSDNQDNGGWNWGGNLVVHEVIQQSNGELAVRVPDTVSSWFSKSVVAARKQIDISAPGKFDAISIGKMPGTCRISATISFAKAPKNFGCILRGSDDFDKGYYIRFEPEKNRVLFDMWPRRINEVPYMAELERMVRFKPGSPVSIEIFVDGNMGVAYINKIVAMNFRAYDLVEGNCGFFVTDGSARFENVELTTM